MQRSKKLSPSRVDGLPEGKHADPVVTGLSLIVNESGKKTWSFRRRIARSGAIVTLKLGSFPAYSIPAARAWATDLNDTVERGEDPRVAIRIEKAKALTLESAHDLYMEAMRRGDRKTLKPRTLYDKEVIYARDIGPRLGRKAIGELTENDCWDAVYDKAKSSKDRANKMAGELSCFLRWCSGREGRVAGLELTSNPAPTLNSNWFSTGPKANKRFLTAGELIWLLQALAEEEPVYRRGIILLLLTAARRNELFGAPSSEFVGGIWTLPAERSKNGDENVVALGPWGRQLAQTNYGCSRRLELRVRSYSVGSRRGTGFMLEWKGSQGCKSNLGTSTICAGHFDRTPVGSGLTGTLLS
ncbi:MAG TPA: integrase family protein [Sphingobium sp.]